MTTQLEDSDYWLENIHQLWLEALARFLEAKS
jgi:hypothetical protein